ncbi:unnamed protein product [Owenia fusiformis]|uniref:[histone H4]-lysine(20) N-methyltransferase n=1 Tax=Owenia fusiformis TaxID=6347 RepID=A0A8J1XNE9_OWEFU|nr:unnamed protein product [Owenia fusiformis]
MPQNQRKRKTKSAKNKGQTVLTNTMLLKSPKQVADTDTSPACVNGVTHLDGNPSPSHNNDSASPKHVTEETNHATLETGQHGDVIAELKEATPFLTPESTPTKDPKSQSNVADDVINSQKRLMAALTPSDKPSGGKKGRNGNARRKLKINGISTEAPSENQTKPKSSKKKDTEVVKDNRLVTDYFPIRRSGRQTKKDIQREKQELLERLVLENCEDGLEVKDIIGKGRGVCSSKKFERGDFVIEYKGDLIDLSTAKGLEKKYSEHSNIGCYMYYFNFRNKQYCIDATAESGYLGRLLNHSCKVDNCMTKVIAIDNKPYLILVAKRDIDIGEELLYDYGDRSKESIAAHPWLAL